MRHDSTPKNIPKFPPKTPRLINTFRNVVGYINIQKSIAFLYAKNEQAEKKIRKTIPLIVASKKNRAGSQPYYRLTPVILATQEAEIRRITVRS
jgi:hypothetical protein